MNRLSNTSWTLKKRDELLIETHEKYRQVFAMFSQYMFIGTKPNPVLRLLARYVIRSLPLQKIDYLSHISPRQRDKYNFPPFFAHKLSLSENPAPPCSSTPRTASRTSCSIPPIPTRRSEAHPSSETSPSRCRASDRSPRTSSSEATVHSTSSSSSWV